MSGIAVGRPWWGDPLEDGFGWLVLPGPGRLNCRLSRAQAYLSGTKRDLRLWMSKMVFVGPKWRGP